MDEASTKQYKVHLIIEGSEESCFFDIVKKFGVSSNIELTYKDACGFGDVASYYQSAFVQEEYDCVLCVYDVDYRQDEKESPYNHIVKELTLILGNASMVKAISFCTNPNILQMLLLGCDCFDNVKLLDGSKKANTPIVHKYWDKIGRINEGEQRKSSYYDAKEWQLKIIRNSYLYEEEPSYSYEDLLLNCHSVPTDYLSNQPGTNLLKLLEALNEGKIAFFESINKKIK